jgi:methionyl-tRNA synthetase
MKTAEQKNSLYIVRRHFRSIGDYMPCSKASDAESKEDTNTKQISLEDFERLDLRIGEIISATPVPGSEKLMKLEIDLGTERRVILSGMRPDFTPEAVVGGSSRCFVQSKATQDYGHNFAGNDT